ncbi:MAG TPA: PepSY domain-containing protein [Casimicrobiaceae bacterium]|nr:PepSY domain-containing protein [Casimicrobiaceae bacterium]
MKPKRALIVGTLIVFTTGMTAASVALAHRGEHGAPVDASKATVTMSQAIATAEQQAGGKATKAKLENETGKLLYEVKVAGKDKVTEVKVDATDGKVLASGADSHMPHRSSSEAKKQ